jgi:hypothetical protein
MCSKWVNDLTVKNIKKINPLHCTGTSVYQKESKIYREGKYQNVIFTTESKNVK